MPIITIAKIKMRSGLKHDGSGIPQLSTGEFGWAIDAQELYIGNGSTSSGAPSVGNTRILTEHDMGSAPTGTVSVTEFNDLKDRVDALESAVLALGGSI